MFRSVPESLYLKIDDTFLLSKINSAEHRLKLITPSVSVDVAQAMIRAYDRLDGRVELITEISSEIFGTGISNPQAIFLLQRYANQYNVNTFLCESGIRIASLVADDEFFYFVPEVFIRKNLTEKCLNAVSLMDIADDSARPLGLQNIVDIQLEGIVDEHDLQYDNVEQMRQVIEDQQRKIDDLERQVEVLKKAKGKLPIQQNLKYIEMEVTGARLIQQELRIAPEFFTDNQDVKQRLKSKYSVFGKKTGIDWFKGAGELEQKIADLNDAIEHLRKDYTFNLGRWKRVILQCRREAFQKECEKIRGMAEEIKKDVITELPEIIGLQLKDLFETLKPNIIRAYKSKNPLAADPDDADLFGFFQQSMEEEVKRMQGYFNTQINVIFREISSEDAENPEFRQAVEVGLCGFDVAKLFSEVIDEENIETFLRTRSKTEINYDLQDSWTEWTSGQCHITRV